MEERVSRRARYPKKARRHWSRLLHRSTIINTEIKQLVAEVDAARLRAAIDEVAETI
jgi:hypothetical protein